MWPAAPAEPRYAYIGQLTGEANFPARRTEEPTGLGRAFAWLIGLGEEFRPPNVLQRPQGVAVDKDGRIYVSDVSRHAVLVFDIPAARLRVWRRATPGKTFVSPIGIAMGADGILLVADAELGVVARLDTDGRPLAPLGRGLFERPTGVARDAKRGRLFVADTSADAVKVLDDEGLLLDTIGHAGDKPGSLNAPTYLAWSGTELYVTDTLNARIQVYDGEGNYLRQVGSRGLYVGNLTRPKGVAVDAEGNLYIAESYYDHLLVFNDRGQLLLPIGGTGNAPGQFYLPAGLCVDQRDRVYIADMYNGRVQMLQFLGGER
ncbi:MAG TPA: 6-bladed beta-propeller [Gammaproteobacteria bacterium]|nr:6-bladed beta-propeller [Gammaproteobacteria bacterium]